MTVNIPDGVDQVEFYKECKAKKLSVKSKYRGVTLSVIHKSPYWLARYNSKYIGRFPFTEEGEKRARLAYVKYLRINNIEERYSTKRTRILKKDADNTSEN